MDAIDLDDKLLVNYCRFPRSFTPIRARNIREGVDRIYGTNHPWPDPLIPINRHFEKGPLVSDLVNEGLLHPHAAQIFRIDGASIELHRNIGSSPLRGISGA
jgi:hypothetical protein